MKQNYGFEFKRKMPEHHEHGYGNHKKTLLNVGIIGVGGLGSTVAHYLLTDPNTVLHLSGRSKNTESIETRVRQLIARDASGDIVEEERHKERIRIYQTIRGETTVNAKPINGGRYEQLERKEKQDFKEHLEGLPNSEKLREEIGEEGKLTLLIEKLILASEQMLVSKTNPAQIEAYIGRAIQIAQRLIQMEQAEEKEL